MFAPVDVVAVLFLLAVAYVLTLGAIVIVIDRIEERLHEKRNRSEAPVPVTRRARLDAAVRTGAAVPPVPVRPGDAGMDGAPRAYTGTGAGSGDQAIPRDDTIGRDQMGTERAARLKALQGGRRWT